jgi:hypothetical protein
MGMVDHSQAYVYRGDRWTAPQLRGVRVFAIRTPKCVRGKNGNMLVETASGVRLIVLARQLRKVSG